MAWLLYWTVLDRAGVTNTVSTVCKFKFIPLSEACGLNVIPP